MKRDYSKPYHPIRDYGEINGFRITDEFTPGERVSAILLNTKIEWNKKPVAGLLRILMSPHDPLIYEGQLRRKVPANPEWPYPFNQINLYETQRSGLIKKIIESVDELSRGIVYHPEDFGVFKQLQPLEDPDKAHFPSKIVADLMESPYLHLPLQVYAVADLETMVEEITKSLKENNVSYILAESS